MQLAARVQRLRLESGLQLQLVSELCFHGSRESSLSHSPTYTFQFLFSFSPTLDRLPLSLPLWSLDPPFPRNVGNLVLGCINALSFQLCRDPQDSQSGCPIFAFLKAMYLHLVSLKLSSLIIFCSNCKELIFRAKRNFVKYRNTNF